MTSHDLLDQLLAATPYPPETSPETSIEELLVAVTAMIARRDVLLAGVRGAPLGPEHRPLVDELARRGAAWQRALGEVHQHLGAQRVAATKARAYTSAF
jgi:hypothetical protein